MTITTLPAFLLTLVTAAAPPFEARTLDGRTVVGTITELSAERLTIEAADGPVSLETATLTTVSPKEKPAAAPAPPGAWVDLVDGSSLAARKFAVAGGKAQITLGDGQVVEAPVAALASVRFQEQSPAVAAEWSQILDKKREADLLVVHKEKTIDYHQGAIRDVTDQVVQFDVDGELLRVKREKVHGLVYWHPPGDPLPEAVCQITDAGGSRWMVRTLALPGDLHWTTPGGLAVSRPLGAVAEMDFSRGKVVFLSDLKPESVTLTPYFGMDKALPLLEKFYGPRQDKNLEAGPLQLAGKPYRKGLALHSQTRLVYRLPGRFRRFQAMAGIDDVVRPAGSVRLTIQADERVKLEATIAGSDPPKPVDIDISGARRLTITADFGGSLEGNHLDLCDARISK